MAIRFITMANLVHGASFREVTVGALTIQDPWLAFSRAASPNFHRSPRSPSFIVLLTWFHSLPPAIGFQAITSLPSQLRFWPYRTASA